ncbi:MAG: exosortase/archaeosortase family protein [Candidatus Iainarchaeum archaeon]|uniref:Exosortase/archaeosortase family protein n=1 Tax=Candidatus Iainarchaeum sp. TaxID=3101447 RepID=A0A7T9DKT3_9ARCH|nr:MAG: exosortase/archaeosortase family protein [Candidatus Diapherotrites archaeon]
MPKGNAETNRPIREGVRFILTIVLVAGILFVLLQPFELHLQTLESELVQSGLRVVGTETRATANPIQFFAGEKLIEISALCSGLMEIILLVAAITATRDASVRKKVIGIVVGVGILFAWNLVRMLISIQQLLHTSLEFAEFTHGVLFRVMLVVGFALIYVAWLRSGEFLETGKKKQWW